MEKITILFVAILSFHFTSLSQSYFDVTKDYPYIGSQNYNADLKTIKLYSYSQVKTVFDAICKSGIEFNYPQGGCQNRAQIMSMLLDKEFKIEHCKVWLFPPADLVVGNPTALELSDVNQLSPNNTIRWLYHVAPCVLTYDKGKVDTLIIDPSIDKTQPLKLSDWLKDITNSNASKFTFLNSNLYFFVTNNNIITGEFYKFQIDTRYWTDNYRNLTMEKGLAINELAIYILNKYIKPLRNSPNPSDISKLKDLEKVFGNIDALTKLFGSQESYMGSSVADNIYPRTLQENYTALMTDAMKFYCDRFCFWTKRVSVLK